MRLKTGEPLFLKRPPRGWRDVALQVLIVSAAWYAYHLVRGQIDGATSTALANGRALADAERSLGLYIESDAANWTAAHPAIGDLAAGIYVYCHFFLTAAALTFLYLRRNASFYFVRNMFVIAMAIGLAGYLLFPTAPPRLLPELGLDDPVERLTGVTVDGASGDTFFNPYAAVPSMHVGFAVMLGLSLAATCRGWVGRVLWCTYPVLMSLAVVMTANHWWIDAVLGVMVAAVAAAGAAALSRWRPQSWSFSMTRPLPPLATAPRR